MKIHTKYSSWMTRQKWCIVQLGKWVIHRLEKHNDVTLFPKTLSAVLKVIVIDRHITLGDMPYANAVLNPKECDLDDSFIGIAIAGNPQIMIK